MSILDTMHRLGDRGIRIARARSRSTVSARVIHADGTITDLGKISDSRLIGRIGIRVRRWIRKVIPNGF